MENASDFSKEDKDNYVVRHVLSLFKKSNLNENLVQQELWMIAGLRPRGLKPHDGLEWAKRKRLKTEDRC